MHVTNPTNVSRYVEAGTLFKQFSTYGSTTAVVAEKCPSNQSKVDQGERAREVITRRE